MESIEHLQHVVLLLAAAVCAVGLFQRLKISPILGYLAAGAALGPNALGVIQNTESLRPIAELGVVFLLFIIGLELSFARLAGLRGHKIIFGTGQVLLTGTLIGLLAHGLGQPTAAAIVVGGGLALSSTAVVMELLGESNARVTQTGRLALATLILQDIAVIPLLVLVPLLALQGSLAAAVGEASIKAILGMGGIVLFGRFLLRPLLIHIAARSHHELFIAATLLIVLGLAWISALAGISPTLGAFLGGLLIAETEFRPQVEADILPFKGLLLGFFFISVGMGIDPHALGSVEVWSITLGLIALKALVMLVMCRVLNIPSSTALQTSLLLAQGGEFAFVLFALAAEQGVISAELQPLLVCAVSLSMAVTPLLKHAGKMLARFVEHATPVYRAPEVRDRLDLRDHVIIAGFGRVGRVIAKMLEAEGVPYVALDMDAGVVGAWRAQGKLVYYGDAGRAVVLKAVGIARAQAFIVTHNQTREALNAITTARALRPNLPILARAHNLEQVIELERAGAGLAVAEMFETSLQLGSALLKGVGLPETEVTRVVESFRTGDYLRLRGGE